MTSPLALCVATSIALGVTGPAGSASAMTREPPKVDSAVLQALEKVPGLLDVGEVTSETRLIRSGAGFVAEGSSGESTTIVRVEATHTGGISSRTGQAVVKGTATDTDTVVQRLPDGGRLLEVIGSANAPQEFLYEVDTPEGMEILPQEDGSLLIGTRKDARGHTVSFEVDGLIGAPWAVDAAGEPVPASYEFGPDGLVTMHVEHSGDVTYPVVADPTWIRGGFRVTWSVYRPWAVNVQLNKARTADAEDVGAGVCVGVAFVPVVGPVIGAICAAHNVVIRSTARYGWCQQWYVNTANRRMFVSVYRGGFCR